MERKDLKLDFVGVEEALLTEGICASLTGGGSMAPLFKTHRDIVIVERLSSPPGKYDVVLYKLGEDFVLHRVIGYDKKADKYIIRGDNTFVKEYIPSGQIIARLCAFRRKSAYKTVDALSYRIYSRLWHFIYPIRFLFHKLKGLLSKIKHSIKK